MKRKYFSFTNQNENTLNEFIENANLDFIIHDNFFQGEFNILQDQNEYYDDIDSLGSEETINYDTNYNENIFPTLQDKKSKKKYESFHIENLDNLIQHTSIPNIFENMTFHIPTLNLCNDKKCNLPALFGYDNLSYPSHCDGHKLNGMKRMLHFKCVHPNCKGYAKFQIDKTNRPIYCITHNLKSNSKRQFNHNEPLKNEFDLSNNKSRVKSFINMNDKFIKTKKENPPKAPTKFFNDMDIRIGGNVFKCIYNECNNIPQYRFINDRTRTYCKKHKQHAMVRKAFEPCKIEKCKFEAVYGYMQDYKPSFCQFHKLSDMFDIKHYTCIIEGCQYRSTKGFKGDLIPTYCHLHNFKNLDTIKKISCRYDLCKNFAIFGKNGKIPTYCNFHSDYTMTEMFINRCGYDKCNTIASYAENIDDQPWFCYNHKVPGMINVRLNELNFIT